MRFDTVIFDLDDTLISWEQRRLPWHDYVAETMVGFRDYLEQTGHAAPELEPLVSGLSRNLRDAWIEGRRTWRAPSFHGVLQQTLLDVGVEPNGLDLDAALRSLEWRPMPGVAPFEDAHDVLTTLRERGMRLGLITNSFQPMWMRDVELAAYGLIDFFDARITSGDTGFIKPHPAIYWRALGMLDSTPQRTMFVGDHPDYDIRGANLVGMTSVYVDRPYLERDTRNSPPDHTITSLSELLSLLEAAA